MLVLNIVYIMCNMKILVCLLSCDYSMNNYKSRFTLIVCRYHRRRWASDCPCTRTSNDLLCISITYLFNFPLEYITLVWFWAVETKLSILDEVAPIFKISYWRDVTCEDDRAVCSPFVHFYTNNFDNVP